MPKLSILLPTYNCAQYISESINSILVQSFTNYELLVIDDGSTDDTESIVKSITDERICYIRNTKNQGIVYSLNKGLQLANGKYIARMDADDIITGNRFQVQYDFLEQNPQYGMVGSWYKVIGEKGNIKREVKSNTDPNFLRLGLAFANHFAHPTVMMRADIAKQLKYSEGFKHCEDHELWTRFAEVSKITNLPYFLLHVRSHVGSTCALNQKELKISVMSLLSRELNKLQIHHSAEELMLHASVCFGLSPRLITNVEKKQALLKWYNKVFSSPALRKKYNSAWLLNFKNYMLANYTGINNQIRKID